MNIHIFDYITKEEYAEFKNKLPDNKIIDIYKDDNIRISLWKKERKIFTIVDEFGTKKLNDALNEMSKLI